jgi:ankyrin repeat protein
MVETEKKKRNKVEEMNMDTDAYEKSLPPINSRIEADAAISKCGIAPHLKSSQECMLLAAMYGLINVLIFYESPTHQLTLVNHFGEGLLHYAAKGNQAQLTAYLLLKGVDPNQENKFLETPIFIAAEMGSLAVLNILVSDKRCRFEQQDKFGDNILHLAARDG